jgi:uncharacterized membrane protein
MRGNVIGFDPDTNTGAISGHDRKRYDFVRLEWRGGGQPNRGAVVDFVVDGQRATQIFPAVIRYDPAEGATAQIVYVLYLVSLAVGVTAIIGLVMAYVNRTDAPDWVQTHYRFQIRTFWIGLLYGFLSLLTVVIVAGLFGFLFTLIWWIVRCVKGLKALTQGAAYENPATWLW